MKKSGSVGVVWVFLCAGVLLAGSSGALASPEDHAYLDPPYQDLHHPLKVGERNRGFEDDREGVNSLNHLPSRSDTRALIEKQTPVKTQGSRGTCSIFSATALLESLLVIRGDFDQRLDLSEEWLEYLNISTKRTEGSTSPANFRAFERYGSVNEEMLPYIGETWSSVSDSTLAKDRCGDLTSFDLKTCLLAHRPMGLLEASEQELTDASSALHDPAFLVARKAARKFRDEYLAGHLGHSYSLPRVSEVKALLAQGTPVTLDLDFYYGAWNHRETAKLGINRDMENWDKGIVGYPEPNSADLVNSKKERAGHSVVVVGYDDQAVVTTQSLMRDGETREFTYKGVYFIKNSWGTESFGKNTEIEGARYPGYGIITQKYAEQYGEFFRLPLQK